MAQFDEQVSDHTRWRVTVKQFHNEADSSKKLSARTPLRKIEDIEVWARTVTEAAEKAANLFTDDVQVISVRPGNWG